MCASGKDIKADPVKRVLVQDEKLDNIVHELSTHKRKASMLPSWEAHNSSRGTHDLEGAWGATLEAKQDQSGDISLGQQVS